VGARGKERVLPSLEAPRNPPSQHQVPEEGCSVWGKEGCSVWGREGAKVQTVKEGTVQQVLGGAQMLSEKGTGAPWEA
jgi:hypothetical protein